MEALEIHEDVARAETPPAALYRDETWQARLERRVLARGWHPVMDVPEPAVPGAAATTATSPASRSRRAQDRGVLPSGP